MRWTTVVLAGLASGIAGIAAAGTLIGWLFHDFQRRTPGTWRPEEGWRQYAASSALSIAAGLLFAVLYAVYARGRAGGPWGAVAFAVLCWTAFQAPAAVDDGLFIDLHPGFTCGRLLAGLATALASGLICFAMLGG